MSRRIAGRRRSPEIAIANASPDAVSPAFERLLADLSARFVSLPAAEVDDAIVQALQEIVLLLDVDRSNLIRLFPDSGDGVITHSWAVTGVPKSPNKAVTADYPWAIRRIRAGEIVSFTTIDSLPPEAHVDRASWERIGAHSHLSVPLRVGGRVEGLLALGCLRRKREWPGDLVARIGVLADVFANALDHKRAREALDLAIEFERTVSEVLASLLTSDRSSRDRVIESGLRAMAGVFGVERATLWERIRGRNEFVKTHRWLEEGIPLPPDSTASVDVPWTAEQLVAGTIVRFGRHADLPLEAAADRDTFRALGISSAVIVPLRVSHIVVGAMSLATSREDREWPAALMPRVKLIGEVFAGVLARDEAERREREAQAQAAHAARIGTMGVVAASLVHELTQPLAASLANAESASELLAADRPDVDELRATVADIVADDRRVGDLIQQLRRFLRRGETERSAQDTRVVIDQVLRFVRSEAAGRGIAIALDCGHNVPPFFGDRVQIQQVLVNLLLNAFDAVAKIAPDSRRVDIAVQPMPGGLAIEVTDNGHGMDEATLARVFQPFFTTKPGGMGLGLSISRTIVAAHGGTLAASSKSNHGTTFRLELPSRAPQTVFPVPEPAPAPGRRETVFVVDDDASMRRAVARQLYAAGYAVETFASAQAFLERDVPAGVACVVSDVRMPGLSGLDLQSTLIAAGRELPIVFVSGHGDIPTTVNAMRAGAVAFLAKPFTKGELVAAVSDAMARSRAAESLREETAGLQARYDSLTTRERQVFALVVQGLLNKVIADRLGTAEATVKIHRGRVMEKMRATSVADLVRMSERVAANRTV